MLLIEVIKSIILGIVQGIAEFLPISSTGHMILVNQFLQLQFSDDFVNTFLVVIQFGSILAVVVLYFNELWPFNFKMSKKERIDIWKLWFKVIIGCIPAVIVGLLFDDFIDEYLYTPIVIAIALIVYGIGFIIVENSHIHTTIKTLDDIDWITALNIGLFQMLALIPGTSRSGSTILGGRILGVSKEAVSKFSFFMAIPIMAGASLLKVIKCGFAFGMSEWIVLITGTLVAFVVSIIAIKFLMNYIKKHNFTVFGIYRIILGILVIAYFGFIK